VAVTGAVSVLLKPRETLFIVLIGIFAVLIIFRKHDFSLVFAVRVEKTRQIN
jgi:hypothetical protein